MGGMSVMGELNVKGSERIVPLLAWHEHVPCFVMPFYPLGDLQSNLERPGLTGRLDSNGCAPTQSLGTPQRSELTVSLFRYAKSLKG